MLATKILCFYFSIIALFQQTLVFGECDRNVGPVGSPECVLLTPYYHKYQWGTCVTNSYMQTASKGYAMCRDHSATYCYYQCMLELYEIAEGK
ncbi:hypothetical protein MHBO_005235 [Bonamia ostreae]|uniref:Secreted protein n=1 Tax=Bonamia ostreae TaxID=126728 RepID=A0ABV2AVI0_9EUKA